MFFANRIGRAASSGNKVQIPWQAWHFLTCAENWRKLRTTHRFWGCKISRFLGKLVGKRRFGSYEVWKLEDVSHEMLVLVRPRVLSRVSGNVYGGSCKTCPSGIFPTVEIGGSLAPNGRFGAPTCLVSSLWFSDGFSVSMGEAATPFLFWRFPSRLSRRFPWQAWHFVTFQPVRECVENFKFGGNLARISRFSAPTCLVSSLWFSCGVAVSMGEAPHSTLYTLHSTLHICTLDSTPCTLRFTLFTLHFTLHTSHFTLSTLHFTLYTLHSALYILHSTLYTLLFTLYTPRSTLYKLHTPHSYSTLYTPHSTLSTPHSALHTLHSTLHTLHFPLHTLDFTLHTPQFAL